MFTFSGTRLPAFICVGCLSASAFGADGPGLGEPVDAGRLDALDFTVMPDGSGLPSGSGNAADGRGVYARHCQSCHGEKGQGGLNDELAGGLGSLTSGQPRKTIGSYWPYATTVFDYIRRAMPYTTPGLLTNDEVYAVTAYLLYLNEIVDENTEIDASSLPRIRMPNRDNFVPAYDVH